VAEAKTEMAPANWQVTATTLECEMVNEYVTIMVYKDWSCKCVWYGKNKQVAAQDPKHKFPKDIKAKIGKCQGPDCKYVTGYRDKLIEEEKAAQK
jgi:hypothetical protein